MSCRGDPLSQEKGINMTDIQEVLRAKPHRITEMRIGDSLFTVISVESDRARERLYNKVKRLILNHEMTETTAPPKAA